MKSQFYSLICGYSFLISFKSAETINVGVSQGALGFPAPLSPYAFPDNLMALATDYMKYKR